MAKKTVNVQFEEMQFKQLKVAAVINDSNLQNYCLDAVMKRLEEDGMFNNEIKNLLSSGVQTETKPKNGLVELLANRKKTREENKEI